MALKRKKKPQSPHPPEPPTRRQVVRHQTVSTLANLTRNDLIQHLQVSIPHDANFYLNANRCSCCDGECYEHLTPELVATWQEPETDEELARREAAYQKQLKQYQKDEAKYRRDLEKWRTWQEENKAALEAEEEAQKRKEIERLEREAQDAQKRLEALRKRIEIKKES